MKTSSITLTLVGMTLVLTACNRPDTDRTTSIPSGVDKVATTQYEPSGLSAPPAPPDRSPVPPEANAAAPGTNAAEAMAKQPNLKDINPDKVTGDSASDQRVATQAQEAAVKAPDTASADAAKKQVMDSNASGNTPGASETARDSDANSPRHGTVTKEEEDKQLPKAGQVNNHSSTALEKDSGR
jgi:hypothetical protein